jgi:uncharacterized protein (UPF0218 family)
LGLLDSFCGGRGTELVLPLRLRPLLASRMPAARVYADVRDAASRLAHERIVVVGDYSASKLLSLNIKPWVIVFDCAVERRSASCQLLTWLESYSYHIVAVENKRSTISCRAAMAVCDALRRGYTAVRVYGEEDLLALPAILCSDIGSTIVYGLPRRGAVVSRVTAEAKRLVASILGEFEAGPQERGV